MKRRVNEKTAVRGSVARLVWCIAGAMVLLNMVEVGNWRMEADGF